MGTLTDLLGTVENSFRVGLNKLLLDTSGLTSSRTVTVPDKAGTLCLTNDLGANSIINQTSTTRNETATTGIIIILCNCTSNAITVNLPTAVGNKAIIVINKTDNSANSITVDPNGAETINGSTTVTISKQYLSLTFVSDNTNWVII